MTRLSPDSSRFARLTTLATAAGLMTALMTSIASADINIELRPEQPGYHVNDTVRIGIYLVSDDATDQSFSAATIMFGWNPAHLELLGVDNTGAVPLLFSDLPADGNVNETLPPADGTGYYGLLANFGPPPVATPAGTLVTTLVFNAETEVCATPVTILAQAGSPPQQTVVYHGTIPNLDVTGTLGSTAVDIDSVAPTASAGSIGACYPSVAAAEAAAIAATSASDNCTPTNELIFNVSTTGTCDVTITLIVEDRAGNTAAPLDYFTRVDGTPPVIDAGSCPTSVSISALPGVCEADYTFAPPTYSDNCSGSITVDCVRDDAMALTDPYPVGVTTVTCTGTDGCGNVSTPCVFTVTVTDDEDPTLSGCPADIAVANDAGLCSAAVSWTPPTADDNCPGVTLNATHNPGDTFPVGTTTVTYTAEDAAGHTVTCSFDVTVTDDEDPTIAGCPSDITVNLNQLMCQAVVSWTPPTATDNCPGVTLISSHNPGDTFDNGSTLVTYTATDAVGHTTLCTFTVTVVPVPDIDDDGDVDFDDLMLFVDVLLGIDTTPLHAARADANCDGLADGDDVQAFLVALYP